jgi:hypothetical protein
VAFNLWRGRRIVKRDGRIRSSLAGFRTIAWHACAESAYVRESLRVNRRIFEGLAQFRRISALRPSLQGRGSNGSTA